MKHTELDLIVAELMFPVLGIIGVRSCLLTLGTCVAASVLNIP